MPSAVDTKPSMPLTPRLAWKVTPSRAPGEALDVAHRHARRDHERRVLRVTTPTTSRATRPSNGSAHPSIRSSIAVRARVRRRSVQRATQSSSTITSTASANAPSSSSGSATIRPLAACVRIEPRVVGIDQHLVDVGLEPLHRDLVGGRRADAQHDVGPVRGGEAVDPAAAGRRSATVPGTRRFDSGSASTGQPATSANRSSGRRADAGTPARHHEPPWPVGDEVRERVEHLDRRRAHARCVRGPRTAVGATGRVDQLVARRHQRLAERQVQVDRARPGAPTASATEREASARHAAPDAGAVGRARRPRGTTAPRRRRASAGRRSGRRRCRAARADGRRCTRSSGPVRGALRGPRDGSSRPRCPTCTARARDARSRRARPSGEERGRALVEEARGAGSRSSPASASASGAERDPGARQASVTPWRAHSSTSVRAKAVVASRVMGGCLRGERDVVLRARLHADRHGCVVGTGAARGGLAGAPHAADSSADGADFVRHGRDRARRRVAATTSGYSQGGRLCLQLALDRPEVVHRLVLVSASPGIADAGGTSGTPRGRRAASRRRSSATASTRSSSAGSRSRCSPRCRRDRVGDRRTARRQHGRVRSRTSSARSGRARSRRTGNDWASCACRCC